MLLYDDPAVRFMPAAEGWQLMQAAVAVSCSVPLSPTVESPLITTEVIEEGALSPPHPAIVSAAPSSRQKRFMRPPRRGSPGPFDQDTQARTGDGDALIAIVVDRAERELCLHDTGGVFAQPVPQIGPGPHQ